MRIPLRAILEQLDQKGIVVVSWMEVEMTMTMNQGVSLDDCDVVDDEEEDE